MRDHRIYDKTSFHEIEMSLTKKGMLHLGETLIRHAILFKNNETLCLKKMGFIYTSENKQLSISVNYPD